MRDFFVCVSLGEGGFILSSVQAADDSKARELGMNKAEKFIPPNARREARVSSVKEIECVSCI